MFDEKSFGNSVEQYIRKRAEQVRASGDIRPPSIQRITFTTAQLGSARGDGSSFKIGFPFKSVMVEAATDSNVTVRLSLHSEDAGQLANYKSLSIGDSYASDQFIGAGFLTWLAQPGKTITLIFFTDGEFKTGTQRSVSSGGVNITDGTTFSLGQVTLTGATRVELLASNSDRKQASVTNTSGEILYLGDATVTVANGFPWAMGATLETKNQGQLHVVGLSSTVALNVLIEV